MTLLENMQPGHSPKRRNYWIPLLVFLLLITGIFIGFYLNQFLENKRPITTVIERNDRVEEIINLVNERFVDSIDKNTLYTDAINGVLKHLDPHTTYIPAKEMKVTNERLEGNFKGIGVEFLSINDSIVITGIIKNSPSEDAGLKVGDKILKIDTTQISGKKWEISELAKIVRGPEDSKLDLTILRREKSNPMIITVKRGLVPLYSIDATYMLDDQTGYIKIERFSATTYREFMKSMNLLLEKGMKRLVLDLRNNPGGYLDAATAILDELINSDKLLVYTKSRNEAKEEIFADKRGLFEKGPLVVLVNEGSASASEIVAGAVQDWDRGVVIGRRSYGKGLVQEQFTLTDGSALRLTVARYYTPSGRNIQRDYLRGKDIYQSEYYRRISNNLRDSLQQQTLKDTTKYFTGIKHRVVYGGGGIEPDIKIPLDRSSFSPALYDLVATNILKMTVFEYFLRNNDLKLFQHKNVKMFEQKFTISMEMLALLKTNFEKSNPDQVKVVWSDSKDLNYLEVRMKAQFAKILFGSNGYYYIMNKNDENLKMALTVLKAPAYKRIFGTN